jgi:lauroyl/myristoyl acyltransferase
MIPLKTSNLVYFNICIRKTPDTNDKNQSQTATMQYQNAMMKKFIEDAGIDISEDDDHTDNINGRF